MPAVSLETGRILSQYRLVEKIGEGGMGEVYKAFDTRLERMVALKVLRPELASDPERLSRFEREAKAVAALNHPNIAGIHQIDEADGVIFIAMELVEGQTLRQRIDRHPLPPDVLIDLALQISDALDAAHSKGVIHRDIKPPNIIVTPRGQAKILDFGLAKLGVQEGEGATESNSSLETAILEDQQLTTPGSTMGTIAYMSPEQVRGEELDARTDLFSFGAVLYEMATGRTAFSANTSGLTFDAILNRTPPPASSINPSLSPRLQEVIERALEKDPRMRYQSAADLRADLKRIKRDIDSGRSEVFQVPPAARETPTAPGLRPSPYSARRRAQRRRRWLTVALGAAALVLSGAALALLLLRQEEPAARNTGPIDSVAVLPFENGGSDPETEYLSDGVTESLINSLSRLPDLRVVPRSLVFRYKGQRLDPKRIGRELSVRAVVTGRVSHRGDTLTVVAELIDAASVSQIWGQQYSRTAKDILVVQDDIARQISRNLRHEMSPDIQHQIARHYTDDTQAYQLYIRSLQEMRKGGRAQFEDGIRNAQQAIVQDLRMRGTLPLAKGAEGQKEFLGFPPAYATLARLYTLQATAGLPIEPEEYQKAQSAAEFALQQDDSLVDAHAALAFVKFTFGWDWAGAEKEFRRALELDPGDAEAHKDFSSYLMAMGRTPEALAEMRRARDLDPSSDAHAVALAQELFWAGRLDEAQSALGEAERLAPGSPDALLLQASILSSRGRHADAISAYLDYQAAAEKESPMAPTLAWFYAAAGKKEEARSLLEESSPGETTPVQTAWVHAALGEKDHAFDLLLKACDQRATNLLWIKSQPLFAPLRSDPRYLDLLRRMNLSAP
jgi:eukaryotic-like serine/threonine-protein kinase